ncbi:MAG: 23S rRNA (guanosine(2251)-2'-O)-methyltransferase RlmB, partial [Oscillospiraceae bacterium]|nr:23S rRNA (guanosine(2251)-2'-O)-methyltransferase RlmB [Oscillospiraceae bacterium]
MENDNIIYGRNAVLEHLLSDRPVDTLYVLKGAGGLGKHIALMKQKGGVVKDCDAAKLSALTGANGGSDVRTGGIALVIPETEYASLEE